MKIAVVTASGLGDGLIFHIFSHNLAKLGHDVVTYNQYLPHFGSWLEGAHFSLGEEVAEYDAIILQHDNSPRSKNIKKLENVYCFYGSYQHSKHGPLEPHDYVCDQTLTIVENVRIAMKKWFGLESIQNGLTAPTHLTHRKYPKRIAIHPDSSSRHKNWSSYKKVAKDLEKLGFQPVFITEDNIPLFPKLVDLASFIYESGAFLGSDSGPGHLASCLQIPTITISTCSKHMLHWRPGWLPPCVITPPNFVSRFKWLRNKWKLFITNRNVIKLLINYINNYNKELEVKL